MDKLSLFIENLNKEQEVKKLISLKEDLLNDEKFLTMITICQNNPGDTLTKKKVLTNDKYKEYKELENNLYFLSLKINRLIKDFSREDSKYACHKRKI